MDIKLPLIIWTIICFGLLALVLDRLLFRPLLKLMDERKAKIDGAKKRLEEAREAKALALASAKEAELAERKRLAEENAANAEAIRRGAEAELRALAKRLEEKTLINRAEAENEAEAALLTVKEKLSEAAEVYSKKLIKG